MTIQNGFIGIMNVLSSFFSLRLKSLINFKPKIYKTTIKRLLALVRRHFKWIVGTLRGRLVEPSFGCDGKAFDVRRKSLHRFISYHQQQGHAVEGVERRRAIKTFTCQGKIVTYCAWKANRYCVLQMWFSTFVSAQWTTEVLKIILFILFFTEVKFKRSRASTNSL